MGYPNPPSPADVAVQFLEKITPFFQNERQFITATIPEESSVHMPYSAAIPAASVQLLLLQRETANLVRRFNHILSYSRLISAKVYSYIHTYILVCKR